MFCIDQLLLEAPEDILCFKFSPTDPNIIAGGCLNGQVVLWDIAEHSERLMQSRSGKVKEQVTALVSFHVTGLKRCNWLTNV